MTHHVRVEFHAEYIYDLEIHVTVHNFLKYVYFVISEKKLSTGLGQLLNYPQAKGCL